MLTVKDHAFYERAGNDLHCVVPVSFAQLALGAEVSVPTLYIWGDEDHSVGRSAATWTAEHVIGPYRFEVIPGIGHFITDQIPAAVTRLLLSHLAAPPR